MNCGLVIVAEPARYVSCLTKRMNTADESTLEGLEVLLAETPVRAAISALEADPKRQTWVLSATLADDV